MTVRKSPWNFAVETPYSPRKSQSCFENLDLSEDSQTQIQARLLMVLILLTYYQVAVGIGCCAMFFKILLS